MPRYIDVDKLKADIKEIAGIQDGKLTEFEVLGIMSGQPIADVVEVVRCKDCKYGEVDDADFPNQYLCNHHGCSWNEGDHYCSYGERKDEGL